MKPKLAILVISCDKYSDLWEQYFKLFSKFWPDCEFKIYLLSNHLLFKNININVSTILIGEDISWSGNLIKAVTKIDEDYIFALIDDFFIIEEIAIGKILEVLDIMIKEEINFINIGGFKKPDKYYNKYFGAIEKGSIYRATTMALWRKEILLKILKEGENAWDFEIYGSNRSNKYDKFYSTYDKLIKTINVIDKGSWDPRSIKKLLEFGVNLDLSKRPIKSKPELLILKLLEIRGYLFKTFVPFRYQTFIKNKLSRMTYLSK